jgi:nickel-dependent lactate racemase
MQVLINYGGTELKLNFPDDTLIDTYGPRLPEKGINQEQFAAALEKAENNLFSIGDADLFVINDAYRPTPTAVLLSWLDQLGKINENARFLIATGAHKYPSKEQMISIFGTPYNKYNDRIAVHNANQLVSMTFIGNDTFNQPVYLNRIFVESEKAVIIGSVEPHYFAGFTGGRKSIFPGLCDAETIARNHNLAVSLDAAPVKLKDNPVAEHLQSLMDMIASKNILSLQTVGGEGNEERISVFCGTLDDSFHKATAYSLKLYGHEVSKQYDLLLAEVLPPLDSSLYQLQKSLENTQATIRDDGTIVLFSPCDEGIGSNSFYELAERFNSETGELSGEGGNFGLHKLSRVNTIGKRININLFSKFPGGIPKKVFFNSCDEPQSLIDGLIEQKKCQDVALVHDAGHTVLINKQPINKL